jgi:HYD1 signature containing ADP-ribosyltransferase
MPTLFHYTDARGLQGVLSARILFASKKTTSPRDVRYGNGQYLTDIPPGTMTSAQLSRVLLGHPFGGGRFSHFVEIDVAGLQIVSGRRHVFVIPNEDSLDLIGRLVRYGAA